MMGWRGENPYEGQTSVVSLGSTWAERWCVWVGTGFGLGLVAPFAPGTFGSLPGVILALAMLATGMPIWAQALLCAALTLLAVPVCGVAERTLKKKDDGRISADEWLLYPIAVIGLPLLEHPWLILSTFLVIRVFDVLKLPPANQVQDLPGGWGIVADDFAAQLMALIANHALWSTWGADTALSGRFLENARLYFSILPFVIGFTGLFLWEKKENRNPIHKTPSWFTLCDRIGRKTFFLRAAALLAAATALFFLFVYGFNLDYRWEGLAFTLGDSDSTPRYASALLFGAALPLVYAGWCATVQRLHDLGYCGWWVLLGNIPGIGQLIFLNLFILPGKKEANPYGLPPFKN